jgi:hypothetical protein
MPFAMPVLVSFLNFYDSRCIGTFLLRIYLFERFRLVLRLLVSCNDSSNHWDIDASARYKSFDTKLLEHLRALLYGPFTFHHAKSNYAASAIA